MNFISLRSRITVVFDKLEWDSTEGGDPTREIDRGRKRARKREGLQHKQNVRPSANIYWLNRTHVRCALTKRYLRSYGNLTIDSSKSLNNTLPPFPLYNFCRSNDTFYWREYFAMFFSKPQYINRNYHKIGDGKLFGFGKWKIVRISFPKKFQKIEHFLDSIVSMFFLVKKFAVIFLTLITRIVNFRRWNSWQRKGTQERDSRRFYVSWIVGRMNILIHSWRGRDYNYQRTAHYDGYRISDVSRIHYLRITNKPPIVFPCDIFVVICHLTGECGQMVMFMLLIPLCIVNRNPILQQMLSYAHSFVHRNVSICSYSVQILIIIRIHRT